MHETRTLSNDWVVRYRNRLLQLERVSRRMPARSTVQVCEARDGQITIRYRDRALPWRDIVPGHEPLRTPSPPVPPTIGGVGRAPVPIIRGGKASASGAAAALMYGKPSAIDGGPRSFIGGTFLTSFDTIPSAH